MKDLLCDSSILSAQSSSLSVAPRRTHGTHQTEQIKFVFARITRRNDLQHLTAVRVSVHYYALTVQQTDASRPHS